MSKYLSSPWHDAALELAQAFPERPGATARMASVVTGSPDGDVRYYQVIDNGRVVEQANGELPDPDFTITSTWADAVKIQQGELDANAAFMQGRMKVAGDMGKLLALLPLTVSPEYKRIQQQIAAITEY